MHKLFKSPSTRHRILSAAVMTALTIAAVVAAPISVASAEDKAISTLSGDHQKQQFVTGERVEVTNANVADDIFALGGDVIFESVSAKGVIAAGRSLSLKGITADDLIVGGGRMDVSGDIKDDVIAAVCPFCPVMGRLHLTNGMQIGDDARLAGRDIAVDGRIGGDLYAAAQQFRLSGEVVGNARIEADRIALTPGARIGGDLLYTSQTKPEVADGAVIAGQVRQVESQLPFAEGLPESWIWYGVLAVIGFVLAILLLGVALQLVAPGLLSNAVATVQAKPWATLGRGLVLVLLVPIAIALLMASVIGIPIGMVTAAAFVVLVALAFVAIAYCIGLYVRRLFGRQDVPTGSGSRILWTSLGIFILLIIGLIPFIGWAIGVLAMIAGLGAVISQLGPVFSKPDTAPAAT